MKIFWFVWSFYSPMIKFVLMINFFMFSFGIAFEFTWFRTVRKIYDRLRLCHCEGSMRDLFYQTQCGNCCCLGESCCKGFSFTK